MNKNILLSLALIVVLLMAGFFLMSKPTKQSDMDTTGWLLLNDKSGTVSFKYPGTIPTQYIHTFDWPPKVTVIEGAFACTEAGEENARAGKTETVVINGHQYCKTTVEEGAAGSTYTQYAYVAKIGAKFVSFSFSLKSVQCGNYNNPEMSACEDERAKFAIDPIIDQIFQTATWNETRTEKITYTSASADLIVVDLPFPGAVTGKNFSVVGKARGVWFFEASFPIELLDNKGNLIANGIAQAQGEWMTENFVPFKADIKTPASYVGPATLVLKKDNASGLPEHDASISFPITIEY